MLSWHKFGILGLVLAVTVCALPSLASGLATTAKNGPDRVIVKFKNGVSDSEKVKIRGGLGGKLVEEIKPLGVQVMRVTSARALEKVEALKADNKVEYAEFDGVTTAFEVPSDSLFSNQWGLNNVGQVAGLSDADLDAPEAWDLSKGAGVKIAILDTGVDQNHEDLAVKIMANKNFTTSRSVDDKVGHGTHVAGIAAAITNNAKGVAGVGHDALIMNGKVLDDRGNGSVSSLASGIVWAADNGAKVINMSLGSSSSSSALVDAINYAWLKGVVLVAAAGNDGGTAPSYPAYCDKVIAVAATDAYDNKASFSNYGSWVDIAAPGNAILSTLPNHACKLGTSGKNYGYLSGTSMASPFVAGEAALVWAAKAGADNATVRGFIESTADTGTAVFAKYGIPRANAFRAVAP